MYLFIMWFIQGVVKLTEADGDTTAMWWNNQSMAGDGTERNQRITLEPQARTCTTILLKVCF